MRSLALFLLLLVFAVAACDSGTVQMPPLSKDAGGEIKEVVSTSSERGTLKTETPTQSELLEFAKDESPVLLFAKDENPIHASPANIFLEVGSSLEDSDPLEVVLTPSERGTLKLASLTEGQLLHLSMGGNPGYMSREALSREFPRAQSGYVAGYDANNSLVLLILTLSFNSSEDLNATLALIQETEGVFRVLRKGNTLVLVLGESKKYWVLVSEVAGRLSRRLGMEVLNLDQSLVEVVGSDELEVVLTPSEMGTLKLATLTHSETALVGGLGGNPGYVNRETLSRDFPVVEDAYLAVYETSQRDDRVYIVTLGFNNSEDLEATLKVLESEAYEHKILRGVNVLVSLVVTDEKNSLLISDIAYKLSRRLGMEVVGSDELEVVLTPSEMGTLKLASLTEGQLLHLSMGGNPGYMSRETLSRDFPDVDAAYVAVYETSQRDGLIYVVMFGFDNSEDLEATLELFSDEASELIFLRSGNTLVLVLAENQGHSVLVSEVAGRLSRRLGMEVLNLDQPLVEVVGSDELEVTEVETDYSIQTEFERGVKYENIAIFVTNDMYSSLSTEIERYKNDIEDEWTNKYRETDVTIIRRGSFTKEYIKDRIKNLWKNENLAGVVLIGDIPHYNFKPTRDLALSRYTNKSVPSDFYYVDVEDTCNYPDMYECTKNPKIWLGRITPPIKNDVSLLEDYFDRNHAYRTGGLQYNDEILLYSTLGGDRLFTIQEQLDQIKGQNEGTVNYYTSGRYTPEDHKIILSDRPNSADDALYFEELKKPYKYVYYTGHGSPKWAEYNITSDVIKANKPQALFYSLSSCSHGDFTVEDYAAGWYLFSGKGLVVSAATVPLYSVFPPITGSYDIGPLERGLSFGETRGPGQFPSTTLLGDPTLHIYDKISSNAEFRISNKSVRVMNPTNRTRIPLKIQNVGSETLKLYFIHVKGLSYSISCENRDHSMVEKCNRGEGCEISPENYIKISPCTKSAEHYTIYEIEPNKEMTIELVVYPDTLEQDNLVFNVLTNDKYYPFIEIPITLG